ncbi:MAG TPA: hypothetical protein VHE33_13415 [Acidobacteriaceae bacterium]|nr:hypothetical protein [Acidobacteriaceae bacterium]
MSLAVFTQVHVAISLIGIASGFVVIFAMIASKRMPAMTALFLTTTILTSVTGFFFPYHGVTPGIVIGVLSLVVLAVAVMAWFRGWRRTWVLTAIVAQFFNFFVLIVQSFEKVPALHALAPTGKEGPLKAAQIGALVLFVGLAVWAYRSSRPQAA